MRRGPHPRLGLLACLGVGGAAAARLLGASNRTAAAGGEGREEGFLGNACAEPSVRDACICNHWSASWGYQCSSCKNPQKWGYGCDADCPAACQGRGCNFDGSCSPPPANCKGSVRGGGRADQIYNARGECVACADGWAGLRCDRACPANCGPSAEGACTRGGRCYRCEEGWYGEYCSKACPPACRDCVMLNGFPAQNARKSAVGILPEGSCPGPCKNNRFGPRCDQDCPRNCKFAPGSSCTKETGACMSCFNDMYFGSECQNNCTSTCLHGACSQRDGTCTRGCVAGYFGTHCERPCPEGIEGGGCDRVTGLPLSCSEAPYGPKCPLECPHDCVGPCDGKTGHCKECEPGFTGRVCNETCFSACEACGLEGSAHCTACPGGEPVQLVGSQCKCVKGASRTGPKGACRCDPPADRRREVVFDAGEPGVCRERCREGYKEAFRDSKRLICTAAAVEEAGGDKLPLPVRITLMVVLGGAIAVGVYFCVVGASSSQSFVQWSL